MFARYLNKRNSPQSPPSMQVPIYIFAGVVSHSALQKVYCVLWGTLLFDYDNEDDARNNLSPKMVVEILGVSEWDGKGRANNYPGGLLLVTHTGGTYYISCTTTEERDEWVLQLRRALECVFANNEVAPFKPSKIVQQRPPEIRNGRCPKTDNPLGAYSPLCRSCGRRFYSSELVSESCVLLQLGSEEAEKVCVDCKSVQLCILWLKTINYVHTLELHDLTQSVLKNVTRFKASFKLRQRLSHRLEMAGELFEAGNLSPEEFEELRSVDHAYIREMQHEECIKLRHAIEAFGEDMQTLINLLLDSSMTGKGGRNAYYTIIFRVLELADEAPDLIEFYFPQLYHIHLQQLLVRSPESCTKVDGLQQAFLVLSQKFPSIGLKLAWNLISTIGDYQEKKVTQVQYAASVALLLQLEMVMTGHISAIADVPTSKLLSKIIHPAPHQQQELAYEISALFLIRRRLQESHDAEELARRERNERIYGKYGPDEEEKRELEGKKSKHLNIFPGTNSTSSCIDLFYHLGVGQSSNDTQYRKKAMQELQLDEENTRRNLYSVDLPYFWTGFEQQLDFLGRLNGLVDKLRTVDRSMRTDTFKKQVTKWDKKKKVIVSDHSSRRSSKTENESTLPRSQYSTDDLSSVCSRATEDGGGHDLVGNPYLGWDPTNIAGEPLYRILRIVVDECRVFRTKARAPTLIICEVVRDDLFQKYHGDHSSVGSHFLHSQTTANVHSLPNVKEYNIEAFVDLEGAVEDEKESSLSKHNEDSLLKLAPHKVVRGRAPSTAALQEEDLNVVLSGIQEVDSLIGSSLNPAIAEMHQQFKQQQEKERLAVQNLGSTSSMNSSEIKSNDMDDRSSKVSNTKDPVGIPRRKSGVVLPINRLASSTEGILRSSQHLGMNSIQNTSKFGSSSEHGGSSGAIHERVLKSSVSHSNITALIGQDSSPVRGGDADLTSMKSLNSERNGLSSGNDDLNSREDHLAHCQKVLSSAQKLLQQGVIDEKEYQQLLMSDQQYRQEVAREAVLQAKSRVENVLGESFLSKKERILGEKFEFSLVERNEVDSEEEYWPAYDLRSFIVKTNDDLRQEICCLQLMSIFKAIFEHFGLGDLLFLRPYRIVCTGHMSGIVEVVPDSVSFDALKRTTGFTTLSAYFTKVYDFSPDRLAEAKYNFMASLAAYSLFTYILQIKDRHNGNLLLDSDGHIIHIDFGFLLSIAPGGSFSVETAPFKLTEEMVELLGGLDSPLFGEFVTAFTKGFIALQANCENIMSAITVLSHSSSFPCFQGKPIQSILEKLRGRFRTELSVPDTVKHCLDLITNSYGHYGTRQYDTFQYYSNGILS
jgi:hypothetical protein